MGFGAVFIVNAAHAQTAKQSPADSIASGVEQAAQLAESGRCVEALPALKRSTAHTADKDLKKRAGFADVRCSVMMKNSGLAGEFLQTLEHEFPKDPGVLYLAVHTYSDLSLRASEELMAVGLASSTPNHLKRKEIGMTQRRNIAEFWRTTPKVPGIRYRLGQIVLSKPETPTAADDGKREFQAELKIDPKNAGAEYVLGERAREAQQMSEASDHFTRAGKIDAGFADAFLELGMALIYEKRFPEAIPPLETAVKLRPGEPSGHYGLAIGYGRAGRKEEAKREAALHKAAAEKIERAKQKAANALREPASGGEAQKPEPGK